MPKWPHTKSTQKIPLGPRAKTVRYYGLWHHAKRHLSSRAWLLLILEKPTDPAGPVKIADLLKALSQLAEIGDRQYASDEHLQSPSCPHCGSDRTILLAEWPPPRLL